ncbi:hypothetical protein [Streptomyces sp. NRRL B-24085]|uniref:hypothetical protein n=1 Tax=Streptomyces sp. NRRL B-24085 TaxID=1709476 RepID=UPI0006B38A01|nr:hypothetical protein [Streptomyces sp. NRRL B-24085]
MSATALEAALADIDTVFNGFASPAETGCERCFLPAETAYLRMPYTRVPADPVRRFVFKVPDHFEDHAAVMRRLLPQTAHAMADGSMEGIGRGRHGLSRVDWRAWPAEQAVAVEAFVLTWWDDTLGTPEPPYPVHDVFETCAMILGDMTPLLDRFRTGPVVAALRSWLAAHAPARLRARGEFGLAVRAELLALPYGDRWAHPYWTSPSATN